MWCAERGEGGRERHRIVRSIYSLTPKKLQQKVSQLILVGFSVLFNILKVYQSRTAGKLFFSRWPPRWPSKPLNDHNSVTINSNLMILVSIPRFLGAVNTLRSLKTMLAYYVTQINTIWRPKWLPTPPNDRRSIIIDSNLMILMFIPRFWGARNTLRQFLISLSC
jgi:hypothetical protein